MNQLQELLDSVANGHSDPLATYIESKRLQKSIDAALKQVQPEAITEAHKYGKSFTFQGAKIEVRNGASRWDYKHVSAWVSASENLKRIEKLSQLGGAVDEVTGEVIEKAVKIEGAETIAVGL